MNDRYTYDAGLWCDALTEGISTHKISGLRPHFSEYDQFFLINDSLIVDVLLLLEPSNEVLDVLEEKNADLVSLTCYWDDKTRWRRHDKEVFGLYLGDDGNHHHWSSNFTYWKKLRDSYEGKGTNA